MFPIAEYRHRAAKLSDHIPWAVFIDDGLILNKDGSFQVTFTLRGPDCESATKRELMSYRAQLNDVLRRLGTRWALFFEAQRQEAGDYPQSSFPDPATNLIDRHRRKTFQAAGSCYETRHFLTLAYLPPTDRTGWAQQLFVESDTSTQAVDYRGELKHFTDQVRSVTGVLQGIMPVVKRLDTAEVLTYLHSCVSTRRVKMKAPDVPAYIDALVCDCPVVNGQSLQIGTQHLKIISVRTYPGRTIPALLYSLNHLPLPFRWSVRWMPLSPQDALKHITRIRSHWFLKRKSLGSLFKEAVFKQESTLDDPHAIEMTNDADAALVILGDGTVSFGYLTLTITVWGNSDGEASERAKRVQEIVDGRGVASSVETFNALEAWLGSLPGHVYSNVRSTAMSSTNLCDLIPAHTVWTGPTWNEHLDGPVLFYCKTHGSTPFRFSNFYQDVGHMMVVGPTGSGKTVLLNLLASQFRRYGGQVFIFDKGLGLRALTLAVGGDYYDLGAGLDSSSEQGKSDIQGLAFKPLARIDQEPERRWAQEWLLEIVKQEDVKVTPAMGQAIWTALENLGKASDPRGRTMSVFVSLLQNSEAELALKKFTLEGAYGHLFDADKEQLRDGDWQAFETEGLLDNKSAVMPVLLYLFHVLEQRFRSGVPSLLILDEAWIVLLHAAFAEKIREWLKTLRKLNVSLVLATQSLTDFTESTAASAIIDNCPTRVFLANAKAEEPTVRPAYEAFGLNSQQIELLATATPKLHYYMQSPAGNRLFELELSKAELAFFASGSAEDQQHINRLLKKHGTSDFAEHLLRFKGLDVIANELLAIRTSEGGTTS